MGGYSSAAQGNSELENIKVDVVFELGRVALTLEELRQLAPGALISLASSRHEVEVSANGILIGRGEIVRAGDSLGVRITRLISGV